MTRPRSVPRRVQLHYTRQTHKYMRYILQERAREHAREMWDGRGTRARCSTLRGVEARGRKAKEEQEKGVGVCSHRGCRSSSPASSSFCVVACYGRRRRSRAAVAAARPSAGRRDEAGRRSSGLRRPTCGHRRLSRRSSPRPPTTCRVFLPGTRRLVPARTRRDRRAAYLPETQNRVSCYPNIQTLVVTSPGDVEYEWAV